MGMLSYTSSVCVSFSLCLAFSDTIFFVQRGNNADAHTRAMRHQPRSQETPASLTNNQHIIRATYMWLESVPIMASWLLMVPPCPPIYLSACVLCLFLFFVFPDVTWSAYVLVFPSPSFPVFLFLPVCLNLLVCLSLSLRSLYRWLEERICFTQCPLLQSAATYVTSFSIWTCDIWSDSNCWPRSSFLSSVGDMTLRLVGQAPFMQFGWFLLSYQKRTAWAFW